MKRVMYILTVLLIFIFIAYLVSAQFTQELCSDSDGGLNYYERGSAVPKGGGDITYDYCNNINSQKESNTLVEFYCESDNSIELSLEEYNCPKGCLNGACIEVKESLLLPFIRGDVNIDGRINLRDVDYLLSFFYHYHDNLVCEDAADMDDDGIVNINDAIILLDYLYIGNIKELPPPNSKDQIDLTEDNLKC